MRIQYYFLVVFVGCESDHAFYMRKPFFLDVVFVGCESNYALYMDFF